MSTFNTFRTFVSWFWKNTLNWSQWFVHFNSAGTDDQLWSIDLSKRTCGCIQSNTKRWRLCQPGLRVLDSTWECGPEWSGASGGWCCGSSTAFWRAVGSFAATHVGRPWASSSGIHLGSRLWTWAWAEWLAAWSPLFLVVCPQLPTAPPQSSQSTGRSWCTGYDRGLSKAVTQVQELSRMCPSLVCQTHFTMRSLGHDIWYWSMMVFNPGEGSSLVQSLLPNVWTKPGPVELCPAQTSQWSCFKNPKREKRTKTSPKSQTGSLTISLSSLFET